MTKRQARRRMHELLNEYGYSTSWPIGCQREFDRLCGIIHDKAK